MKNKLKIINGDILTPYKIIEGGSVLVENGRIVEISQSYIDSPQAEVIDAKGSYVSPGFIDLHVHGGAGHDFMDHSIDAFLKIAELHAKHGTTAMCPTTLTSLKEDLIETLHCYEEANKVNKSGAQFLGMHIEGPYFSMEQRGAQDPRYIRDPDPNEYKEILKWAHLIRRWSAAPELDGAMEFARYLKSVGVLPAIAHTDAVYEEVQEAFENGYTLLTHFYSAMSGVTRRNAYRYAGVIESGYLIDELDVEIIADGVHLPVPLLKLIYKIKGPSRTALITDAMRGAGMGEGESILGDLRDGVKVIIEDGVAKLPDRSAFAGSVATADRLVRTMCKDAGINLLDTIQMITSTPARIIGIEDKKGSIVPGKDADIVIFDKDINIINTIIGGKSIYKNEEFAERLIKSQSI
ncbi:N-acetylglucosamine 6-phosphate deacetylase [Pseudopedobacter saltans DSM 12145]|uniref:N-acetylglucosamine 6-phosphate deacetylase n=1 Tax=Pseudopedobacter saltans (strain ATCC 51119 / DSM 12145 / JCM 21818 / CCUG 39354 / LMG 10337 / NBRC 100064 / NCIMB 13643) TaxID=762903 RepID=F0S8M4_PSESL|nr:N-acetylglucosamine-6-phosphate deacetylase [Pseudopedobacter saltans]ADY51308.1 N-acetylglucosamine 6-phosphate deacetylase [Pseudopedobacter saltans DSM 12145]